jgi:PD-(D/E)XK nuclease superfamily
VRIEDFQAPREVEQGFDPFADDPEGLAHPDAQVSTLVKAEPPIPIDSDWVLPLDHFSASSLNMLEICPRQWQQRYLQGRKEPPGQSLVLGSLTHSGIEFGLDVKMVTEADPDLEDMVVYFHDAVWPQTIERYGGEGEVVWDDKPEDVRRKGAELVTVYHPRITTLQPEAVEHEFRIDIGAQVPITGYIDLVQKHGRPSIDFKTSAKRRPSLKPDWRMQGRVYQLVVPRPVDFHQITTGRSPEIITGLETDEMVEPYSELIAVQTKRRIAEALNEANRLYAELGPDEDWPMRGVHHDWRCSPKWCAYRKDCPAWQR